jgi:CRISPR system Cascade subunit CasA
MSIAWPRADLRAAMYEFLIGLFSTIAPPRDAAAWRAWWNAPPTPQELQALMAPFAHAFWLDGDGPRILQDAGDLGDADEPVAGLFIEQPGANTEKNNTDLFQKRGSIRVLGRSTAAMALFTLQNWAPSGGAGHRTGVRGGGPMTTLALPDDADASTLWRIVWLNVVKPWSSTTEDEPSADLTRVFPWLAPTRISSSGLATTLVDVHPAQAFWGMPRRIRLHVEPNVHGLPCDVTGRVEEAIVRAYATTPWGTNYVGLPHPLSPTYRAKANAEWLPAHPQPGSLAWRYWPGLVIDSNLESGRASRRAACIDEAAKRLRALGAFDARLWIFGYDMSNAQARGFLDAQRPLFCDVKDEDHFAFILAALVESATETASVLSGAIRDARRSEGGVSVDVAIESFWTATEDAFWTALRDRVNAPNDNDPAGFFRNEWLDKTLRRAALSIFDREAPIADIATSARIDAIAHVAEARQRLSLAFAGYGASGRRLFAALQLAPPSKGKRSAS